MSKMSIELVRYALSGPTMGTHWSALFFAPPGFDIGIAQRAFQASVDEVDGQMSTWKPDSDLMRLNRAPVGETVTVPAMLEQVIRLGMAVGRASGGAFDMAVGDAVVAWGFGPWPADAGAVRAMAGDDRVSAHEALGIGGGCVTKRLPVTLDLNAIAKGFGVDRLADTLERLGLKDGLLGIDGEMKALGLKPDGRSWTVAVEAPDPTRRTTHSILALTDCAVATSGDYRHFIEVAGRRLAHTIDPQRGAPLTAPPASVSVVAQSCAAADAWATALMVLGQEKGPRLARQLDLQALFLVRDGDNIVSTRRTGSAFDEPVADDFPSNRICVTDAQSLEDR